MCQIHRQDPGSLKRVYSGLQLPTQHTELIEGFGLSPNEPLGLRNSKSDASIYRVYPVKRVLTRMRTPRVALRKCYCRETLIARRALAMSGRND